MHPFDIYTYLLCFLFVNYYYSKIVRTKMQAVSSNFQKYINQIQFLRKQINGEKISHQNTLKQLQSSYQIIDDLKDVLRTQQASNLKLKNEISSLSHKVMTISHQYEDQIHEIKDMIALKDQELRRLNSYLMVNDADMIRLKVINQVQIGHKEELERYGLQIMKKNMDMNQIRANWNFAVNKNQVLQRELKILKEENMDKVDQMNNKFAEELKSVYESLQKQRNQHKKIAKKYEFLQNKYNKQSQFYKQQISKLNKQLQNQNKSLLSNTEAKTNKHRIQKLQQTITKQKQELLNDRSLITKLQDQIGRLKKELKNQKKNEIDINNEKDRLNQEVQVLKKDIINRDSHYKKQIQTMKKQVQRRNHLQDKGNINEKDKINRLENENKRLLFKVEQLNAEVISMREELADQNVALLRKTIKSKDNEIEALEGQLRELKNISNDRKRTVSAYDKKSADIGIYKAKLQQANDKIVELLREKIELKQQINQFLSRG